MPSKGVALRLGARKREHNRLRRERRAMRFGLVVQVPEGPGPSTPPVCVCACGFVAKTAQGLKVHQTRKGHR